MCLITTQRAPFIAEQDMVVYKFLKPWYVDDELILLPPFYQGSYFSYKRGELYTTELKYHLDGLFKYFDDEVYYALRRDFPCGPFPDLTLPELVKDDEKAIFSVSRGFHSALTVDRLRRVSKSYCSTKKIYECIIPKGSEYILGYSELIVSNKIIIEKVVPLWKRMSPSII